MQVQKGSKLACGSMADAQAEAQTKPPGAANRKAGSHVDALHGEIGLGMLNLAKHWSNCKFVYHYPILCGCYALYLVHVLLTILQASCPDNHDTTIQINLYF